MKAQNCQGRKFKFVYFYYRYTLIAGGLHFNTLYISTQYISTYLYISTPVLKRKGVLKCKVCDVEM